jgi:beta-N-acetylhexosaminidase
MADLAGETLSADEYALLENPWLGGIILFSRNFSSIEQVTALVRQVREVRPELIIAVDQEGGRVQRFQQGFTRLPAMQQLGVCYGENPSPAVGLARDLGWLMAAEVRACGVDLSFAPVLDVDWNHCSVIGDRAFSDDVDVLVQLATAFIEGMHEAGMAAVGKHFPGHGGVEGDSHLELPHDNRSFENIRDRDLRPFGELIQKNLLEGIMPAHVVYSCLDDKPAVFSSHWLQDVLRNQLDFNGTIFSDDLSMKGAEGMGDYPRRAMLSLEAGCDMILVCNNRTGADEVLDALKTENYPCRDGLDNFQQHGNMAMEDIRENPRYRELVTHAIVSELN